MPDHDNHVCRCSAVQIAQACCLVIAALTTMACSVIGAYFAAANHSQGQSIEMKQDAEKERTKKIENLLYIPPDERTKIMPPEEPSK